jgi:hypothetical protein
MLRAQALAGSSPTSSALMKMKSKLPLVITMLYASVVVGSLCISRFVEFGHRCYAVNPDRNYGFISLPCYFFDSLYKNLLNPFYSFFSSLPLISSLEVLCFGGSLVLNSIILYMTIVWILRVSGKIKR